MTRLELREGDVLRYWEATIDECVVRLRWGVQGGRASTLEKVLPTPGKARAEVRRLVKQHQGRGYLATEPD